jgi:hypothetical protein
LKINDGFGRDLAVKTNKALTSLVPEKKTKKLSFLKKKMGPTKRKDYFASKGWIDLSDMVAFERDILAACGKFADKYDDEGAPAISPQMTTQIMHIVNFHLEMELMILRQVTPPFYANLLLASSFLAHVKVILAYIPTVLPMR